MKITITGGAGFLGSVLTQELLEQGMEVTVVDNFMFRQYSLAECCQYESFRIIRGDCRNAKLMRQACTGADFVIPLAALVGAPLCDRDEVAATSTNRTAIEMLCEILSPEQKILYPTTNSGYGIGEKNIFCTEDTPLRPISLYGMTKTKAEEAVLARGNGITFRLATVFGVSPRMRLDLLVNDFVFRACHDRAVILFEAQFKRNYIHVRDVARVFIHGIRNFEAMKNKPYNVGLDDANLSKWELCETIRKHLPQFVFMEAPIGEDPDKRDYIVSNERIRKTRFRAEWSLDRGIQELIKGFTFISSNSFSNI